LLKEQNNFGNHVKNHKVRAIVSGLLAAFLIVLSCKTAKGQSVDHWETIVEASDIWSYFPGTSEPPAAWAGKGFDDSSWLKGPGGIGYGDNDDATVIDPVGSVYLRIRFNIVDRDVISAGFLNVDFDDGFVAYINGHEVARENIGTTGIRPLFNQYATLNTYEAMLPSGGTPAGFLISDNLLDVILTEGENILAVQVHNCNATSSDLSSTTFLSFGVTAPGLTYKNTPSWFTDPLNEYSELPVIMIDTRGQTIQDKEKITAWCSIVDNGSGNPNGINDYPNEYNGFIGIEIRGQSSKNFPKKSYGIELRDSSGNDIDRGLLGLPPEEDWVLYAPYSDKSLLRNAITYYLGSRMGRWQPRIRFCSMYLNGSYNGIYMFTEKIKRGEDRVNISKLNPDELAGDDLTGGYIFKVDKTGDLQADEYFTAAPSTGYKNARNYTFSYVYPDADVIAQAQRNYLRSFLVSFQNSLNGSSFTDPVYGYPHFIDIQSFIDFQIIQELTNNVDGYRFSTFFYKEKDSKGGKLHAGPLWDFDLCYGNVNYNDFRLSTSGWLFTDYGPAGGNCMHWWARLMEDESYAASFSFRWKELRKGPLSTDSVMYVIDSYIDELGEEIDRNFDRWKILGKYVWPNSFIGNSHQEEIDYLKDWIEARMEWMDDNIEANWNNPESTNRRYITLYPNPAKDELNIRYYVTYTDRVSVEIHDMMGRKISSREFVPEEGGFNAAELSLNSLPAGNYIVSLKQGSRIIGRSNLMVIK